MPIDNETKTAIEGALKAFSEIKTIHEDHDKTLKHLSTQFDALDKEKFSKLSEDVAKGIEANQKAIALAEKAAKDQEELRTAFNRVPGTQSGESDEKALRKRVKKEFNAFARMTKGSGSRQMYFDEYLDDGIKANPNDAELKSLSANSDPNGGYTVLPEISGPIEEFVYESSPIRQLATVTTVGTDSLEIILDNDQAAAGWVGESDTRTATKTPVFQKLEIPVNEMYANAVATQKILDDSMIDLESWLAQKVSDYFSRFEGHGIRYWFRRYGSPRVC